MIENFSPIFYIFGACLIFTAWRQAFPGGHHDDDLKKAWAYTTTETVLDEDDVILITGATEKCGGFQSAAMRGRHTGCPVPSGVSR